MNDFDFDKIFEEMTLEEYAAAHIYSEREMTLDEYVSCLPDWHLVKKEGCKLNAKESRFIKAVFRDALGKLTTFSCIGAGATVTSLLNYLNFTRSDASPQHPWELVEVVRDMKWMSRIILWEEGCTIDEMYADW